ncbi:MAG: tetratricopeptide repeat protein [Candidatus Neomarinimicrobiota bacterium]|nr:tetratricopeptide repeat protein [Candidatus Neomarinimicrobiota bacterium]
MLKPRRKIIKKELKKDPYIEFLARAKNNLDKNQSMYQKILLGAVVVIIAIVALVNNHQDNKSISKELLGKAVITMVNGDIDNARIQFEFVSDEYKNNESGSLAKYYLARLHFSEKDYLAATSYLNEIRNADFPLNQFNISKFKMMALIAMENEDYDDAISYYERALSNADLEEQKHLISLDLADITLIIGDYNRSMELVQLVLDKAEPRSTNYTRAEELFGQIKYTQSAS